MSPRQLVYFPSEYFVVCIGKMECDPANVKHLASMGHDWGVVAVVGVHLGRQGAGIVDLEFLQLSLQVAIAALVSDEISQPQSGLAHSYYLRAPAAFEVVIGSLVGASPWAVHKDSVVELMVPLVATLPPPSLSLSSQSRLPLAWAAAIADSLGKGRSSFRQWDASP
jgi:hypothetical protein